MCTFSAVWLALLFYFAEYTKWKQVRLLNVFMQHIAAHDRLKLERLLYHTVRDGHAILTVVVLIMLSLAQLWFIVRLCFLLMLPSRPFSLVWGKRRPISKALWGSGTSFLGVIFKWKDLYANKILYTSIQRSV